MGANVAHLDDYLDDDKPASDPTAAIETALQAVRSASRNLEWDSNANEATEATAALKRALSSSLYDAFYARSRALTLKYAPARPSLTRPALYTREQYVADHPAEELVVVEAGSNVKQRSLPTISAWALFRPGVIVTLGTLVASVLLILIDEAVGLAGLYLTLAAFCLTDFLASRRNNGERVILPPTISRAGIPAFTALAVLVGCVA